MNDVALLIPSLEPTSRLVKLVKELKEKGFEKIVIVNDGSDITYDKYFDACKKEGCHIISYRINKGKGYALKKGIEYIKKHYKDIFGVITLDSDGQHTPKDVAKIYRAFQKDDSKLVLGVRNVMSNEAPLRSRFGNTFSAWYFFMQTGVKCSDTQTGLRAIPVEFFDLALKTEGDRFEYEMHFLLKMGRMKKIREIKTATIYENNNKGSHFKTFRDSYLIYKDFFKYSVVALLSALLDLFTFYIFTIILQGSAMYITLSTVIARLLSGIFNFSLNRNYIFKSRNNLTREVSLYLMLFLINMLCSSFFVTLLSSTNPVLLECKIIVDFILFIIGFFIQKKFIFRND